MFRQKLKVKYEPSRPVIHRSGNRIICAGDKEFYKPDLTIPRGWASPDNQPYAPVGNFQKVVPFFEGLKKQLPNSTEISAKNQKHINNIKRNMTIYKEAEEPMRCWQIMTRGVADMRNIKGEVDVLAQADDE